LGFTRIFIEEETANPPGTDGSSAFALLTTCVREATIAIMNKIDLSFLKSPDRLPSHSNTSATVELHPIAPADLRSVAEFLHDQLNPRITPAQWAVAMTPPWPVADQPNYGYHLRAGGRVVGVYLAFYSERKIDGRPIRFCNLGAWCVLDEYRSLSLRLLHALLAQKDYCFTDLSPSGSVIPLNVRLKFSHLDVATALVLNLPWPVWSPRVSVISKPREIEGVLRGRDLEVYRDHARAAAARHVVVVKDGAACYVMFRKDRRKKLPLFASILYVGNPELFQTIAKYVFRHLLIRHRILATLVELRVVGDRPKTSVMLKAPRRKMYRSSDLRPEQIDYLYSELTCLAW
jgi:hypothetical protein